MIKAGVWLEKNVPKFIEWGIRRKKRNIGVSFAVLILSFAGWVLLDMFTNDFTLLMSVLSWISAIAINVLFLYFGHYLSQVLGKIKKWLQIEDNITWFYIYFLIFVGIALYLKIAKHFELIHLSTEKFPGYLTAGIFVILLAILYNFFKWTVYSNRTTVLLAGEVIMLTLIFLTVISTRGTLDIIMANILLIFIIILTFVLNIKIVKAIIFRIKTWWAEENTEQTDKKLALVISALALITAIFSMVLKLK